MMTLTFLVLSLAPLAMGMVAFLVGALVASRIAATAEAPTAHDDAQEWADALSLELDVDSEWSDMHEAIMLADAVDAEWSRLASQAIAPRPKVGAVTRRTSRRNVGLDAAKRIARQQRELAWRRGGYVGERMAS